MQVWLFVAFASNVLRILEVALVRTLNFAQMFLCHLLYTLLCVSVKRQPTHKWHIWFLPTHEPTLKKPKEPFFANATTIKSKFDEY